MCLLSIIIPIFNAVDFLDECLRSIIRSIQEDSNLVEILLINDGSTDGSGEICEQFSRKYTNIHVFHKPNEGVSSARNLGLDHAVGRYIAWVDPDDYVSDDWFSCIKSAIDLDAPDIIVMDTVRFGQGDDKTEIYGRPGGWVDRDIFVEDVIRDIRILSGLPNKVMKAVLFNGIRFDTSLSILEDYMAMPHILKSSKSVYYIPKCLYFYRQTKTSLLHQVSAEQAFCSVENALDRKKIVAPEYHCAAVTAVAWQAFLFSRSHYLDPAFGATKEQVRFCNQYIRKQLILILNDKEISKALKVKMLLCGIGVYGAIIRLKRGI